MSIFISYSHENADFVDKFAVELVKHNALVWLDRWELNVGDSLIERVQSAITESSALAVVLSSASVQSEWCKKELSVGLIRELDEKRVLVLPILIENCDVPIFLRDKVYADFRSDFDKGMQAVLDAVAKIANPDQGRIDQTDGYLDWALDWGYDGDFFKLRYTIVQAPNKLPMTFLIEVEIICNEASTKRYLAYEAAGLGWFGRRVISEMVALVGDERKTTIKIEDQFPQEQRFIINDTKGDPRKQTAIIRFRRIGEDNGKHHVLPVGEYLKLIRDFSHAATRELTSEEASIVYKISRSQF